MHDDTPTDSSRPSLRRLPRDVWALGVVSLLMDTSSELVHSLLPVFMVSVLGASMATVGIVEGMAEATASMLKMVSGAVSDRLRRRKPLVVAGYALAALSKPAFPLATSVGWVFAARFVDRVGKGIRGAPRDALIADVTPPSLRGTAYGLRQALDSVGAVLGPLSAVGLMAWLADDISAALWAAVVPAVLAVTVLVVAVHEPMHTSARHDRRQAVTLAALLRLPRPFWMVVLVAAVFTLARFSEAFLVLRALDLGLSVGYVPVVLIVMNLAYAGLAYPAGLAADRIRARPLLAAGLFVLVVADALLAMAGRPVVALIGAACWGVHMALTQGLLSKLVANAAPTALLGSAFGVFYLVSAIAALTASLLAGTLWSLAGPRATFMVGGLFAALALAGVMVVRSAPRQA